MVAPHRKKEKNLSLRLCGPCWYNADTVTLSRNHRHCGWMDEHALFVLSRNKQNFFFFFFFSPATNCAERKSTVNDETREAFPSTHRPSRGEPTRQNIQKKKLLVSWTKNFGTCANRKKVKLLGGLFRRITPTGKKIYKIRKTLCKKKEEIETDRVKDGSRSF